jgi:hypothetical protein
MFLIKFTGLTIDDDDLITMIVLLQVSPTLRWWPISGKPAF